MTSVEACPPGHCYENGRGLRLAAFPTPPLDSCFRRNGQGLNHSCERRPLRTPWSQPEEVDFLVIPVKTGIQGRLSQHIAALQTAFLDSRPRIKYEDKLSRE